jgi:hypothetical protein
MLGWLAADAGGVSAVVEDVPNPPESISLLKYLRRKKMKKKRQTRHAREHEGNSGRREASKGGGPE